MKIRIMRGTTINGGDFEPRKLIPSETVEAGAVIAVTRPTAQYLVGIGKAEHFDDVPLGELASYEVETAMAEPPETTEAPRARTRRRAG